MSQPYSKKIYNYIIDNGIEDNYNIVKLSYKELKQQPKTLKIPILYIKKDDTLLEYYGPNIMKYLESPPEMESEGFEDSIPGRPDYPVGYSSTIVEASNEPGRNQPINNTKLPKKSFSRADFFKEQFKEENPDKIQVSEKNNKEPEEKPRPKSLDDPELKISLSGGNKKLNTIPKGIINKGKNKRKMGL
ncbi:MAG: hypothetical protein ACOCRK_01165 [bacterium]